MRKIHFTAVGLILLLTGPFILAVKAYAHCPLCTIGAGVAAATASLLGVKDIVLGVFVGALAMSLGLWFSKKITKKFIPKQKEILTGAIFLSTVLPLLSIMEKYTSIYISFAGEYGSLLNRTYIFNYFLLGSILGAIIMLISPRISKQIKHWRNNKSIPFQGLIITFGLLILIGIFLQIWV